MDRGFGQRLPPSRYGEHDFQLRGHGYDTGDPRTQRQGYTGALDSGNRSSYDQRAYASSQPRDPMRDFRSQMYDRDLQSRYDLTRDASPDQYGMTGYRSGERPGSSHPTRPESRSQSLEQGRPARPASALRSSAGRQSDYHRAADASAPQQYEALMRSVGRDKEETQSKLSRTKQQKDKEEKAERERLRVASRQQMEQSYNNMMSTFSKQQAKLASMPAWKTISTRDAKAPGDLTITHINQTHDLNTPGLIDAKFAESMSSEEWLVSHSLETLKLTVKDLVAKGKIGKPGTNHQTGKVRQHIQFEAHDINEFEYRLNMGIEQYTNRIKWLLQGSRRFFGLVKGSRVGVMIDASDSNCGFGRLSGFQDALTHLLDEQLSKKKGLYLQCFGSQPLPLWNDCVDINCRSVAEAKQWIDAITPSGGTNVLKALKVMFQRKDIDTILLILGSTPDHPIDVLIDYVDQLGAGCKMPIQTVAYDSNNHITMGALEKLAENSGGRFHCYASGSEDQLYKGTDVRLLVNEIKKAQEISNTVKEMRDGMLGTALVSVINQITTEVAKLPQSRFLPRPPGHEEPLRIEAASFQPSSSFDWLSKHGLKAKNLDLYQVLAPNAYSFMEEFIPVIRKTVHSQVHGSAMTQFEWYDGTMKNVHVDMTQLFEYQKQLGATVRLYEKRIDWLGSSSRKIFGTVTENRVIILVDLSISNLNYLIHIQHSLRLLMEQQMANKEYFNIIGFGSTAKPFRPTMVKPTPENLQAAWKFVLDMQCAGSRNFMDALRMTVENEEEYKHHIQVEGIYLFTSGIPDQQGEICCNYVDEAAAGQNVKFHVALFNVDDYDAHGAIPSRYANITKTAECLRNLAHCAGGRFHWFRETGIIESDDIALINLEIEKALNFSKKCGMLVNSVKKKYNIMDSDLKALPPTDSRPALMAPEDYQALPPPKHTVLTQTRVEKAEVTEATKSLFRPSSAHSSRSELTDDNRRRCKSAKNPMARVKGSKVQRTFFFTEEGQQQVGSVFRKYPDHKPRARPIKAQSIPDKEEQATTKEWLRKYSLQRLKLNLNKTVSGADTRQTVKPVKILNKSVEARVYRNFPTISVNGQMQYLQLQPHELREYEKQVGYVLKRYLRRLQWLLSGSRRVFGNVVEQRCVFLVDTSGSMDPNMEELKRELASLIWDQLHKYRVRFNFIQFSRQCEQWESELMEATEANCHRAVQWVSNLTANGNTCTLEALELAFIHPDLDAIYLLTDGKPDTSTSLVLKEVTHMNNNRNVVINTISFNCEDATANNFMKMLSSHTSGRYHRCQSDFDAQKFAHKLLSEGFEDHEDPPLPDFEGEDLKRLGVEITAARRYLAQSKQYRAVIEEHYKQQKSSDDDTKKVGPGQSRPKSAKV